MRILTLIIHAKMHHEVGDILHTIKQVEGFTFTPVQGHGSHAKSNSLPSSHDRVVGYTPRMKVEILLQQHDLQSVLESLRKAMKHERSQGVYWIVPVEESGLL